ncbi:unnamed protein product [Cuscuta campestris]|uniref:Uncharacterized protein n=1 Tax=Cuscuta campestris TaxID=132261 RepID=A0A484MDA9_9ASTE|nr:unnamed protein product [Cuscuta campestris]
MAASSWSSIGFPGPNSSAGFLSRRNPSSRSQTTSNNIIIIAKGLKILTLLLSHIYTIYLNCVIYID